jgi:hypothetical protein
LWCYGKDSAAAAGPFRHLTHAFRAGSQNAEIAFA